MTTQGGKAGVGLDHCDSTLRSGAETRRLFEKRSSPDWIIVVVAVLVVAVVVAVVAVWDAA